MKELLKKAKKELEKEIEKGTLPLITIKNIKECIKALEQNYRIITLFYDVAKWFYSLGFRGTEVYKDPKLYNNYNISNGYLITY